MLLVADGGSPALLVVGLVLFGLGVGNAISVPPVIANLDFSKEDAARAVALIVAISQGAPTPLLPPCLASSASFGRTRSFSSRRL